MTNYTNGKIYKMFSQKNEELLYVGSTTTTLANRISGHRHSALIKQSKSLLYRYMREQGAMTFKIILVEMFPCSSKEELRAREEYWRTKLQATLNTFKCFRTEEEYIQFRQEYQKTYSRENKDRIRAKNQKYQADNAEELRKKASNRYHDNTQRILERNAQRRDHNREKKKCHCPVCNVSFGDNSSLNRHRKSKKHQDNMLNNSNINIAN